jgi:hypothetical protein
MAFNGSFNELNDDLKFEVVKHINSSKEFVRLIASGKSIGLCKRELQTKFQQLQHQDYVKIIHILHHFTTVCLGLEKKFSTDENLRNNHLDMFLNGYANSGLLEDNAHFKEYNETFADLIDDLVNTEDSFMSSFNKSSMFAEVVNKLRFKQDLKENAKQTLFKPIEDDYVEHELVLDFESGVKMNIVITIYNATDDPFPSIDVFTSFITKKSNKPIKYTYVVSGENEDYGEDEDEEFDDEVPRWINNDPVDWITTFLTKLRKNVGRKSMLGDVKNIEYKNNCQQFWIKAYFLLEVLPHLAKM